MGGVRTCRVTMASAQRSELTILGLLLLAAAPLVSTQYLGQRIGSLSRLQHEVKGDVYAVDSRTIHIKGFSYDGAAPDAFFYGGVSGVPSDDGFIIPDENGSTKPLSRYNNKDVTLTLPEGITLKDVKWISVWCRAFAIDFGHVVVPSSLQYPRPQKINALTTLDHGVKSDRIVVVDAQTFLIPNFNYDGVAPGGYNNHRSSKSSGRKGSSRKGEDRRPRPSSGSSRRYQSSGNSRSGERSSEENRGYRSEGFASGSRGADRSPSRQGDYQVAGHKSSDSVFGGQGGGFGYLKSSSFGDTRTKNSGRSHSSSSSYDRHRSPVTSSGYSGRSSSSANVRASSSQSSGSALALKHFG